MNSRVVGGPIDILLLEGSVGRARTILSTLRSGPVRARVTWLRDAEDAREFLAQQGRYVHAPTPDVILLDAPLSDDADSTLLREIESTIVLHKIPHVRLDARNAKKRTSELLGPTPLAATLKRVIGVVRATTRLVC